MTRVSVLAGSLVHWWEHGGVHFRASFPNCQWYQQMPWGCKELSGCCIDGLWTVNGGALWNASGCFSVEPVVRRPGAKTPRCVPINRLCCREPQARGDTTSLLFGPSSTGAKATHCASPDNRLHKTDSLACSHTGLFCASPVNRLHMTDSLACRLAGHLRNSGNQLPRTHSLAGSFTGSICAYSPTDYPGTQMPVAGRRHIAPDHLDAARIQHDTSKTTLQHTASNHFPVHHLALFSAGG